MSPDAIASRVSPSRVGSPDVRWLEVTLDPLQASRSLLLPPPPLQIAAKIVTEVVKTMCTRREDHVNEINGRPNKMPPAPDEVPAAIDDSDAAAESLTSTRGRS